LNENTVGAAVPPTGTADWEILSPSDTTAREGSAARVDRKPPRMPIRVRKTVLVLHIISSVALVGEVWVLVVLNLFALLTDDLGLAHAAYRLMDTLVFAGGIPLSLTALISGVVLALSTRWGLVRHYWVFTKLLLLIATILVGMLLFNPAGLATAVEGASRPVTRQWGQVAAVGTQLVMLITATVLSVFKPWSRTSIGKRKMAGSQAIEPTAGQ
jgi:hypothetical protein